MFRHPQYYKNLRKLYRSRNRDQAISLQPATAASERAPGTGQQLGEVQPCEREATPSSSSKHQATSVKHQALKLSNQPG